MRVANVDALRGITLEAVVSKRKVRLDKVGFPAVFLFHDQHSAGAAAHINQVLRADFPRADELLIASVVNLAQTPRLLRPAVESALGRVYQRAAGVLPAQMPPEEYMVILPDWRGQAYAALGWARVDRQAGLAVVNAGGQVAALFQDEPAALAAAAQQVLRAQD